jgi:tRNA pseudouridine38-40 synthase
MSNRFRVRLAYDGTGFHGSQFQPELRTVQGDVEKALRKLNWQGKTLLFAGRTDAGVHATGQVIAFDYSWDHTEPELQRALNAVFPQDISALQVKKTKADFHPRYDALSRKYQYKILCSQIRDPLQERFVWRVWPEVDVRLMIRATRDLIGTHDFAALGNPHQPGGSTVRNITRVDWKKQGDLLIFEVVGNAFLYHMIRRIVLVAVKIGQGKAKPNAFQEYLSNPSGSASQGLAPASGLSLVEVRYD